MKKIKLEIIGLSYSQTQSGAYTLVLGESKGKRRLPIIIGGFEAQAIAIELEKMIPNRPLTHDLFKSFANAFQIQVTEVVIYNLVEGVFHSKLICEDGNKTVEIDTRTSDAIALAVRFKCPIYTYEFILSSSGVVREEDGKSIESGMENTDEVESESYIAEDDTNLKNKSTEELKEQLSKALEEEQYERASQIRDELNNRKKS